MATPAGTFSTVYLLDAEICIELLSGAARGLVERLKGLAPAEVGLSAVVKAELLLAARAGDRVAENLTLLSQFFAPFATYPFDDLCAEHYGMIRADLARVPHRLRPVDLLLAATARAHDLTLVTHNLKEFSRIVGLRTEDWAT